MPQSTVPGLQSGRSRSPFLSPPRRPAAAAGSGLAAGALARPAPDKSQPARAAHSHAKPDKSPSQPVRGRTETPTEPANNHTQRPGPAHEARRDERGEFCGRLGRSARPAAVGPRQGSARALGPLGTSEPRRLHPAADLPPNHPHTTHPPTARPRTDRARFGIDRSPSVGLISLITIMGPSDGMYCSPGLPCTIDGTRCSS